MDKRVSSPQLIRSPLSSIINLSRPTSEERPPEDEIYNASPIDTDLAIIPTEYGNENEIPQLQLAQEIHIQSPGINRIHIRTSRSQSLEVHYPTQLDTIVEVSTKASSRDNIRLQRSQSLDEGRLQSRLFQTSSSNDGLNYRPIIAQYPKQPLDQPPERITTPPNVPRFNTIAASIYHIPSPSRTLRERLDGRPSPERLSWIRQTSGLPPGAVMRAGNGTLVSGLWQAPPSGHTGNNRCGGFDLSRNPFDRPSPLNMHPTTPMRSIYPVDLEAGQRNKRKTSRKRWRRV